MSDPGLDQEYKVVTAINNNTRATLALVRLLSERMPMLPVKHPDMFVTPEGVVPLTSKRGARGGALVHHMDEPPSDREVLLAALDGVVSTPED